MKTIFFSLAAVAAIAILIFSVLYQPVLRPWHTRFGATEAETTLALPGDDLVHNAPLQSTRAITIHASAEQAWPWLLQLGQGRGGLFSYDFLENLAGCDIHTLDFIDPALQTLQVGDVIRIGSQDGLPRYQAALLEAPSALVLRVIDQETGQAGASTWGFYLLPQADGTTRLLIRHRDLPPTDSTEAVINAIFEPISFVMEERMLRGLRQHAEQ